MMEAVRKEILIVDDTPANVRIINTLLQPLYSTRVALSGAKALELVMSERPPDLILLDVMMPEMNGYEVCAAIKAQRGRRDIPIVFLTSRGDIVDELHGFDVGASDYLSTPVRPSVLLARVRSQLELVEAQAYLLQQNRELEEQVAIKTRDLAQVQEATMIALGSLAESRDHCSSNHIRRTQLYIRALASRLSDHPRFESFATDARRDLLFKAAALHDIGKVGIPDRILLKSDPLTVQERNIIKTHTLLGRDTIHVAECQLEQSSALLALAREIAHFHHEHWDGSGYPEGIAGEAIPPAARLMAVADVYDALTSKRVYRDAFTHDDAVRIVSSGRATQFDPAVVEAFLGFCDDLPTMAAALSDPE